MTLCPQLAMLCLDLRPKTADVQVLIGLWQFRMIQGTQLPEIGASVQQSQGGPSQHPLSHPLKLESGRQIRERQNAHSKGLCGPEVPGLGDIGVEYDLCSGSYKGLRQRFEGAQDQRPASTLPQPVRPWPSMALPLPMCHFTPGTEMTLDQQPRNLRPWC